MCKGIYNSDTSYGNMDLSLPSQCFFTFSPSPLLFFHTFTPSPSLGPQSYLCFVLLHLPIGIFNLTFTLVALLLLL